MLNIISILLTSFIISLILGYIWLYTGKRFNLFEPIHGISHIVEYYKSKIGTVTMGGIIILITILIFSLWINSRKVFFLISIGIAFATLGFIDDILKIKKRGRIGLKRKTKIFVQLLVAFIFTIHLVSVMTINTAIRIPLFNISVELGAFYIFFATLMIVGSINSVNISDGLDGLAMGIIITIIFAYTIIAYTSGDIDIFYFCLILIGSSIGFLFFNKHPARMFLGDLGASILGLTIAGIAIILKQELLLPIVGGVLVIESLSSVLQLISLRYFKKKIFPIAPLHHTFQKIGWSENGIVYTFWLFSLIFSLLGLVMHFI